MLLLRLWRDNKTNGTFINPVTARNIEVALILASSIVVIALLTAEDAVERNRSFDMGSENVPCDLLKEPLGFLSVIL